MGLRESMNSNPLVGGLVVIVVLALAAGIYFTLTGGESELSARAGQAFYYDLQSGSVFQADEASASAGSSDREPIRAYLFSCGDCGDSYVVGYLAQVRPEVREALGGRPLDPRLIRDEGFDPRNMYLVAAPAEDPSGLEWVEEDSGKGQAIKHNVSRECPGGPAKPCAPGTVKLDS